MAVPAEYDETSKHPPTLSQVHGSGLYTSNVKAGVCAAQPPDPRKTMLFLNELCLELTIQSSLKIIMDDFIANGMKLDDNDFLSLKTGTLETLNIVNRMLEYPQLANEFDDSSFLFTVSYDQIERKTRGMSKHIVKKEWTA